MAGLQPKNRQNQPPAPHLQFFFFFFNFLAVPFFSSSNFFSKIKSLHRNKWRTKKLHIWFERRSQMINKTIIGLALKFLKKHEKLVTNSNRIFQWNAFSILAWGVDKKFTKVSRVSGGCLEGVWRVSGGYLEGVWKVLGRCLNPKCFFFRWRKKIWSKKAKD